jgi:hypothetical protein
MHFFETKLTNLKLKTLSKQLLGFLVDITLPLLGNLTQIWKVLRYISQGGHA